MAPQWAVSMAQHVAVRSQDETAPCELCMMHDRIGLRRCESAREACQLCCRAGSDRTATAGCGTLHERKRHARCVVVQACNALIACE